MTLSDGSVIPRGSMVFEASVPLHYNDAVYPNANEFDGMRFYREGAASMNNMTIPTLEWLAFGYGPYAWYGIMSISFFCFRWRRLTICAAQEGFLQ